jgi:hypothetical protein
MIIRASSQWFPQEGLFLEGDYSNVDLVFTLAASNESTAVRIIDHSTVDYEYFVRQYLGDKTGVRVFLSVNDTAGLDGDVYYWDLRKADGTHLVGGAERIERGVRDPNNGQSIPNIPSVTITASSGQVGDFVRITQVNGANVFEFISLVELKALLDAL